MLARRRFPKERSRGIAEISPVQHPAQGAIAGITLEDQALPCWGDSRIERDDLPNTGVRIRGKRSARHCCAAWGSVAWRNYSVRPGSTSAGKVTLVARMPGGGDSGGLGLAWCSQDTTSSQIGAALVTPLTFRLGSPERFPTQTPM